MVEVIRGDAHDIAGVMTVMNDAFDPQFGEAWTAAQCLALLALPHSQLMLAKTGHVISGFALTRWVLDEEELLMIAVASAQQGQNIGAKLLKSVRNEAQVCGRKKLYLEVRDNNKAHKFYVNQGFEEVGRRKGYYRGNAGQTFDAITMAATIT